VGSADEVLQAGVKLAGNTVKRAADGIDNIGAIVAGAGSNVVKSTLQKQEAKSQSIEARDPLVKKKELLQVFGDVRTLVTAALSTLHGVQKTALAGKMNIYKRAKCGFFRRATGLCETSTISQDMKSADLFLDQFKSSLNASAEKAKIGITTATGDTVQAFQTIEIQYNTEVASEVNAFVSAYEVLIKKYDTLTRQALGIAGARRKTYRKRRRVTRASRKRPSVRARSS
jgi:hypothetical protein